MNIYIYHAFTLIAGRHSVLTNTQSACMVNICVSNVIRGLLGLAPGSQSPRGPIVKCMGEANDVTARICVSSNLSSSHPSGHLPLLPVNYLTASEPPWTAAHPTTLTFPTPLRRHPNCLHLPSRRCSKTLPPPHPPLFAALIHSRSRLL